MDISLCVLKPDVFERNLTNAILNEIIDAGFEVYSIVQRNLTKSDVDVLYLESQGTYYYDDLKNYMLSGPCTFFMVHKTDGLNKLNDFVGCTDPQKALDGTLRAKYGQNILKNSIHSSNLNRLNDEICQLYNVKDISQIIRFPFYFKLKDGTMCHTVNEQCYEGGKVIGLPKYFPVKEQTLNSRKIDGSDYVRNNSIDESMLYASIFTDIKVEHVKHFGEKLCKFGLDEIQKIYNPFDKAKEIANYSGDVDILNDCKTMLNIITQDMHIPLDDIGVEGSILLNGYQPSSDLDIVIKGEQSVSKLKENFAKLSKYDFIHLYDESNIELVFSRRKKYHSFANKQELLQQEQNRTVGLINGRRFWLQPILGSNLLDYKARDLENIGLIEFDGVVTKSDKSYFWPTYYTVNSKSVGEIQIECYDPIYMNQAVVGDNVYVRGCIYFDKIAKQKLVIFSPWVQDVQIFKKNTK